MKPIEPLFRDFDVVKFRVLHSNLVAFFMRMLNYLGHVLRVEAVKDVEEVLSLRDHSLRKSVREILHKPLVLLLYGPQIYDSKLLIHRNVDKADLGNWHQLLFISQHLLEEVLMKHFLIGKIELYYREVRL